MLKNTSLLGTVLLSFLFVVGCTETDSVNPQLQDETLFQMKSSSHLGGGNGVTTVNGWYEGEEIYYIDHGPEEGVTERGVNQIYAIDAPRKYQANVVLFIPGEPGYSVHWNVNIVHTSEGTTVQDIIDAGFASPLFGTEGVLFDDVADVLSAESAGLVIIVKPGIVVNCPVISKQGAEAPGNNELPEEFEPFDLNAGF